MLDGAALGTLIIGLDSARQDAEWSEASARRSERRTRSKPSGFRVRLAIALRSAADRLDRPTAAPLGSSGLAA